MDLKKKTLLMIHRHRLLKPGDRVVVGISGGPDSVGLLHILRSLQNELGLKLTIAHFNHKLRSTSDKDERFVRCLAEQWRLPIATGRATIKKGRGSLEEKARQKRFSFLKKTAQRYKAKTIALAHNKNDLAETVLMRILRGTGLMGLRAIMPKRTIDGYSFIRPLLETSREEIEHYLRKNKLKSRKDKTNNDTAFFRNKIRHKLIPHLQKNYNVSISDALCALAKTATEDYAYIKSSAVKLFKHPSLIRGFTTSRISVSVKKMNALEPALQHMILRLIIHKLKGNTRRLTYAHIEETLRLFDTPSPQMAVSLPQGIRGKKNGASVVFYSTARR